MKHATAILTAAWGVILLPFQLAGVILGAIFELIATLVAALAGVTIIGGGAILLLVALLGH